MIARFPSVFWEKALINVYFSLICYFDIYLAVYRRGLNSFLSRTSWHLYLYVSIHYFRICLGHYPVIAIHCSIEFCSVKKTLEICFSELRIRDINTSPSWLLLSRLFSVLRIFAARFKKKILCAFRIVT